MTRERWTIVIEPLPSVVPASARMRQLLKHALRSLRLKCIRVEDAGESEATHADQSSTAPGDSTSTTGAERSQQAAMDPALSAVPGLVPRRAPAVPTVPARAIQGRASQAQAVRAP